MTSPGQQRRQDLLAAIRSGDTGAASDAWALCTPFQRRGAMFDAMAEWKADRDVIERVYAEAIRNPELARIFECVAHAVKGGPSA